MPKIRQLNATGAGLALGWAFLTVPSFAQSAGNKAAAEAIFEQGKLLMQSGDYAQACLKFEASQKLDEGIGTLLYLADCYEKTGRSASAWAMFKEAASIAGAQGQDSRQKLATQRAHALEPGLVKVIIDIAKGDEGLLGFEVRNDGVAVPAAQYGAPVPIDPGEHRIEASAPGKRTYSEVINVTKGVGRVAIPLLTDLAPPSGATPPATPTKGVADVAQPKPSIAVTTNNSIGSKDTASSTGKNQRIVSYALGGLGVVGVGVGTYFGLTAIHNNSQSKSYCQPGNDSVCYDQRLNLYNDAVKEAKVSTVAFIAGGALLATGAVLYFTAPDGNSVTANAAVAPNVALISLGGTW